jgi:hypothetical protein
MRTHRIGQITRHSCNPEGEAGSPGNDRDTDAGYVPVACHPRRAAPWSPPPGRPGGWPDAGDRHVGSRAAAVQRRGGRLVALALVMTAAVVGTHRLIDPAQE